MSGARGETFVIKEGEGIDFSAFLVGLASSALIHLGLSPNPDTGTVAKDLLQAKQTLEVLAMLRERTRGNLTPEEDRLFENLLTDLRLRFVEVTKVS